LLKLTFAVSFDSADPVMLVSDQVSLVLARPLTLVKCQAHTLYF